MKKVQFVDEFSLAEMERDPDQINRYTEILFSDVFAEPAHVHSPNVTWTVSKTVFLYTSETCYSILSAILSLPIALLCGIKFACLTFDAVWCCQPLMKCSAIKLVPFKHMFSMCIHCWLDPFCEALGMCYFVGRNGMVTTKGSGTVEV